MAQHDTNPDGAFRGPDDPRFDGYVMSLARKQAERDFHFGLGQLVVGCGSAALFIYWTIKHFSTLGYLPGLFLIVSVCVLLGAGRKPIERVASMHSDLGDTLSRQEKYAVFDALGQARSNRHQTTPGTVNFRRKVHILLLLRLLAVVAIFALIIVVVALDKAKTRRHYAENPHLSDPNLTLYSNRYASDEFWVRNVDGAQDGLWYGVGP